MDIQNYQFNNRPYEQYRAAQIAKHIITHNGENDLPVGMTVNIRFVKHAYNALFRRYEPVYEVEADGKPWGHLYGNALKGFVG